MKKQANNEMHQLLVLLLLGPVLFLPSLVSAKGYILSNGMKFEGTAEEYDIAEKIIEESKLPMDDLYSKAFEKIIKKNKYKIFNVKDLISGAQYVGNAGYDKRNKVFYLDSKNGKSEILLTINHPFTEGINREQFSNDFSKEIKKNIKKELKREPLDFRKIDLNKDTDLYYLTSYYVVSSLISNYEDSDLFFSMFLRDVRIDLGKVKNKCIDVNKCAYYITASTEKESFSINEKSVNQYMHEEVLPNNILWPQTNFKIKTIFFENPSPIVEPVYVYLATDQRLLSAINDRIEVNIKDIRFLSKLKTGEAGLQDYKNK